MKTLSICRKRALPLGSVQRSEDLHPGVSGVLQRENLAPQTRLAARAHHHLKARLILGDLLRRAGRIKLERAAVSSFVEHPAQQFTS
jgi:hypothetical protein